MRSKNTVFFLFLFCLLTTPLSALAGAPPTGSISFAPVEGGFMPPAVIPTMGGLGLLLLALVLGGIALQKIRSQGSTLGSFLVACLALGAVASAGGGLTLIAETQATTNDSPVTNPDGETLEVVPNALNNYPNNSGVDMSVVTIDLPDVCEIVESEATCMVDDVIVSGGSCELDCQDQRPQ